MATGSLTSDLRHSYAIYQAPGYGGRLCISSLINTAIEFCSSYVSLTYPTAELLPAFDPDEAECKGLCTIGLSGTALAQSQPNASNTCT